VLDATVVVVVAVLIVSVEEALSAGEVGLVTFVVAGVSTVDDVISTEAGVVMVAVTKAVDVAGVELTVELAVVGHAPSVEAS
jgi:hypothetical protein